MPNNQSSDWTYVSCSKDLSCSAQLQISDLPSVVAAGFRSVINNRPDHEGGSAQPSSAEIQKAAEVLGLVYVHQPVISGKLSEQDAILFSQFLMQLPKPILAFCRSGMRSRTLYDMALDVSE